MIGGEGKWHAKVGKSYKCGLKMFREFRRHLKPKSCIPIFCLHVQDLQSPSECGSIRYESLYLCPLRNMDGVVG